ncbi:MAG: Haloalkane dehalogenase [Pseudomonadota bacterium]
MSFTSGYVRCAGHELHYTDWGRDERGTVLAWHGLARTGRDMDELAEWLSQRGWRVICPDTIGRGLSQWSSQPAEHYQLSFYARLARELLDALSVGAVHWVGTSMGGAIGMRCAAGRCEPGMANRLLSLVLNDNAPELAQPAVDRIKAYAGQPPAFATVTELEGFLRQAYQPFGWLSDAQWRRLTETSVRRLPDGRVTPHYDPAIVQQFVHHPQDYWLWDDYDALQLPVLMLRGAHSDLVLPETVQRMRQRGPGARGQLRTIEVPGCGHAPALNVRQQLEWVSEFLDKVC